MGSQVLLWAAISICLVGIIGIPLHIHNSSVAALHDASQSALEMARARRTEMESLAEERAQLEEEMKQLDASILSLEGSIEQKGESLRVYKGNNCGLNDMERRHRDRLATARRAVDEEARPKEIEARESAKRKDREQEMEAELLADKMVQVRQEVDYLHDLLKQRGRELEIGKALRDNDAYYVQTFLSRMARSVDTFVGSYMMNAEAVSGVGDSIMLRRWDGEIDRLGAVTQDLLDIIPKMDPFIKPHKVIYKTCAVVGNAGLQLYYKYGADIDKHEAVVRFNAGPTKGFEDFVGKKTSVRFVNRMHFGFQERATETVLQQVTTKDALDRFIQLKKEMPASRIFMVSPDFHAHVLSELTRPATNGLYGILFALQRCKKVSLYGFFRGDAEHVPYHYFDTEEPVAAQRSRDVSEGPLIFELVRHSNGRMRVMEPCLMPEESAT